MGARWVVNIHSMRVPKGEFTEVVITDLTLTDIGQSTRFGTPHNNAAAISVKTRDDNASYAPMSFTGPLTISDGTIDGTSTGIRAGEINQTVSGPSVNVVGVIITDAVHDAQNGDVEDLTSPPITVTLIEGADTLVTSTRSTGPMAFNGLGGDDAITRSGAMGPSTAAPATTR